MIPTNPEKFKSEFSYHYIEDENGQTPKCYEGMISYIPLECKVEDGIIRLFGKQSIYKTKCFNLKFNNHNYGMLFELTCYNKHENFKNKTLWRRSVDKKFLHQKSSDNELLVLNLEGDAPEVPNCPVSIAKINLIKERNDFHAVEISIEFTLDTYDLFISRYSD